MYELYRPIDYPRLFQGIGWKEETDVIPALLISQGAKSSLIQVFSGVTLITLKF